MSLYTSLQVAMVYKQEQIILGEANFFSSVKDGSFVASPSGKWRLHTLGSFGRSNSSMPRASSHCCLSGIFQNPMHMYNSIQSFLCLQTMHSLPVGILYLSDRYVQKKYRLLIQLDHDQFYKSVKKSTHMVFTAIHSSYTLRRNIVTYIPSVTEQEYPNTN